jgi:hypothetical protein
MGGGGGEIAGWHDTFITPGYNAPGCLSQLRGTNGFQWFPEPLGQDISAVVFLFLNLGGKGGKKRMGGRNGGVVMAVPILGISVFGGESIVLREIAGRELLLGSASPSVSAVLSQISSKIDSYWQGFASASGLRVSRMPEGALKIEGESSKKIASKLLAEIYQKFRQSSSKASVVEAVGIISGADREGWEMVLPYLPRVEASKSLWVAHNVLMAQAREIAASISENGGLRSRLLAASAEAISSGYCDEHRKLIEAELALEARA